MVTRVSLEQVHVMSRTAAGSRATGREFDDKHLVQQIKKADVFHSETVSNFERFQPVGLTSVPLDQEQDQQQQPSQSGSKSEGGNWNHNQPKGKAAEIIMAYPNGSRSLPMAAVVDDRRVRPYAMEKGGSACYHAAGTGQMCYFNGKGAYLVSVNNPAEQSDGKDVERFASLRHATKKKQPREIKKDQQIDDFPHEGETVNTEVRCTKDRIEFRIGDMVVAYIEANKFATKINTYLGDENATHPVLGDTGAVSKKSKKVFVKAEDDAHPTSLDTQP